MSFSKNPPPWALPNGGAPQPSLQAQMGLPNPMVNFQAQPQPVFSQGLTISTPQAPPPPSISSLIQPPAALNPLYTQTVSYPTPRPMNTIAYPQAPTHQLQQHPQMQPQQQISPQAQQQLMNPLPPGVGPLQNTALVPGPTVVSSIMATQRAYTGTVTKIQDDVGFIDDEIFFHKSVVCKGSMPKVGERVFVEASYAQNTPFKWNASRVQLLSAPNTANHVINKSSYNSHENGNYHRSNSRSTHHPVSHHSRSPPRRSLDRSTSKREISRDSDEHDRRRRPPPPQSRSDDRDKERRDRRDYSPPSIDRRERSPAVPRSSASARVIAASPPLKKRRRMAPRYLVRVPNRSLNLKQADLMVLKQRYSNLYIPSDFFHSEVRWSETFTPDKPFVLRQPCAFHFMNKETVPPAALAIDETLLEPPDADNTFTAKVMLMSVPPMSEIFRECLASADDSEDSEKNQLHPTRMISFLVGERGRGETMGIGGPWSPALDGKNPDSDPTVLIRTAIRTCKALTGIDLSRCTQWHRFMELFYQRRETGRVHTVVVYLPDIRSCLPSVAEWQALKGQYKAALDGVLDHQNHNSPKARNSNPPGSNKGASTTKAVDAEDNAVVNLTASKAQQSGGGAEGAAAEEAMETGEQEAAEAETVVGEAGGVAEAEAGVVDKDGPADDVNDMETEEDATQGEEAKEETVDPKSMKIPELKKALSAMNLPIKGLKADLVERLTEALKKEEGAAEDTGPAAAPVQTDQPLGANKPIEEPVDESNQSTEDGEPDLANMVVIDECCDPTKQKTEEPPTTAKATKKLDEKEVRQLERRYTIPDSPEIIVHPSKTAKGGKFDCALMTLTMLLNYGQDDSKEHSFEVSLFAELFNEMLLRDSAFNIYKALYDLPERKEEDKAAAKGKEAKEEAAKRDDRERKENDKEANDDDAGEKKKRDKERKITVNPELLLSFSFFDQTNCGYMLCKDLEELISTIGLSLSRSQIKKLVGKASSSETFYYRKLTDKDDKEATTAATDSEAKPTTSQSTESAVIAKGNFHQWPIFRSPIEKKPHGSPPKANNKDEQESAETGMVLHNGTLVNVEKLMERIKAAERALLDSEQVVADLKKENVDLSAAHTKSQAKIKDLTSDVNSVTRKLDSLAGMQKKNSEYLSVFASINEKIAPFLVKKEKERSTPRKSESNEQETKVKVKQEVNKPSRPSSVTEESIKKEK